MGLVLLRLGVFLTGAKNMQLDPIQGAHLTPSTSR